MKKLGIDYGDARTGVAISDAMLFLAQTLTTIYNDSMEHCVEQLLPIIQDNNINTVVIGYPKNMNGTIGERGEITQRLAQILKDKTGVETVLWDERLTTVSAHRILSEANVRGKKRKKVIDSVSATFILQGYLDSLK